MEMYCKACDMRVATVTERIGNEIEEKCPSCSTIYESMTVPVREPIIEFKDQEELESSLDEWQERLFLHDWIIRVMFDSEIDAYAQVEKVNDIQSAIIKIRPLDDVTGCRNTKYCAEKSLVHELLHLKLDLVDFSGNVPIEAIVFDYTQHQKIDRLSMSLIMAKYGIPFSWFKNFD